MAFASDERGHTAFASDEPSNSPRFPSQPSPGGTKRSDDMSRVRVTTLDGDMLQLPKPSVRPRHLHPKSSHERAYSR